MRFGSVCSGIEAASVAWEPLGWKAAWFSEIEPFPCAVLAHHYPSVPNLGDMTTLPNKILEGEVEAPDVFCGGTPCQAFSVAGKRQSLDDARGNLSLVFCEIANAIDDVRRVAGQQPTIVFWENVPGVLSTKDNAFGCFLGELAGESSAIEPPRGKWTNAGCVYGPKRTVAWRVLDAQYFGVAQRRRRVFVVASARDGFDPAAILFEFDGLRRDTAPRREAGQGTTHATAPCLTSSGRGVERTGDTRGQDPVVAVARPLLSGGNTNNPLDENLICMAHGQGGAEIAIDRGPTLTCNHEAPNAAYAVHGTQYPGICIKHAHPLGRNNGQENCIAFSCKDYGADAGEISPTLRSMGHDGSHANAGGQGAVALPFDTTQITSKSNYSRPEYGDPCHPIAAGAHAPAVAVQASQSGVRFNDTVGTLDANYGSRRHNGVMQAMQVRRLTPVECERLQGFPDNYTNIPWRKKPESPDGPRYKALGNSWAVPNVRWIGKRIQLAVECAA